MAIDHSHLDALVEEYQRLTGENTSEFVCPITLRKYGRTDLINGHIMNRRIPGADRRTIIQSREVDHFFGHTIEPQLVSFFKASSMINTHEHFVNEARSLEAIGPSGERWDVFVPPKKSEPPYAKRVVTDNCGDPIKTVCIRAPAEKVHAIPELDIEATLSFEEPAIVGSLLKSAHLALFAALGYGWALGIEGLAIGAMLRQFVESRGTVSDAARCFAGFQNCCRMVPTGRAGKLQDSIRDQSFLLHFRHKHRHDSCVIV